MRHLVRSRSELQDRVTELIEQQTAISEVLRGRSDLPIYLFSGSEDPVGQQLRGLHKLIARYRDAGLSEIAFDFYPGGRHEMLNETTGGRSKPACSAGFPKHWKTERR
jgi:alpha-beta hydrolase superfamily lysophospholipase